MASQASEISTSWTNNPSIGSFASKLSWNFNAFFYVDYPDEHFQVEPGPKRRRTKGHRAYVCLHCQNPPWSNRVPGNAIHHAETAHRALIRASEAANDTLSGISTSGVSSGAIDSYIISRPSQAALRNCFNKQVYIEAVVGLLTRRRLPFSAVEYSELRDLALACNPAIGDLLINNRKQAMGYINSNYSLYSSQLAESLQTAQSKIHMSSDLWTSPHRHGVLAICAQWVNEDFKLQKALLGLLECKYSHSGAVQARLIASTLQKFNITAQNLGYYTGDNATSNDTCLEELAKILEAELGVSLTHTKLLMLLYTMLNYYVGRVPSQTPQNPLHRPYYQSRLTSLPSRSLKRST